MPGHTVGQNRRDLTTAMGEFREDGIQWRILKWNQQLGEWLEVLFGRDGSPSEASDWIWPEVLATIVLRSFQVLSALLLVWILWQLALMLIPPLRQLRWSRQGSATPTISSRSHSLEEWLQLAQGSRQRGNYGEACRALYMALLRHLHDHQILPDQPSRTDGEYLRQLISLQTQPLPAYELLIATHERLCFDRATPISATTTDQCFQALHQITQPTPPPAGS